MNPIYERELIDNIDNGAVRELRLYRQDETIVRVDVVLSWSKAPRVLTAAREKGRQFKSIDRLLAGLERKAPPVPRVVILTGDWDAEGKSDKSGDSDG